MKNRNSRLAIRFALAVLVLLIGLSMLPLVGISAEKLGWEAYAGIYQPQLRVLGKSTGAPGSAFEFSATGYPADVYATVYVNGRPAGLVLTSSTGRAGFIIRTTSINGPATHLITLALDENLSASDDITIATGQPTIVAPERFSGPSFYLSRTSPPSSDMRIGAD